MLKTIVMLLLLGVSPICAATLPTAAVGGDRFEIERRQYGASDDRLQARASDTGGIELAGKWQMSGRDAGTTNLIGVGQPRALPEMKGWQWHEVSVPGSVRSGLLEAGVIEDPYWSDNAPKSLWTEKQDWWFRKAVVVPEQWSGQRVFLGFDGVDYYSSIWFNGQFLGDHEGMYGGPVQDVTRLVRFGQTNEVVVQVHPGGTDEPGKAFKGYIFMKWHYLTDISPRGVWRGARLVATGPVRLENPFVRIQSANDKEAALEITADLHNPDQATQVLVKGRVAGESFKGREQSFSLPVELAKGDQAFRYRLRVAKPRLWWPAGMGAADLYRLTLTAQTQEGVSDSISTVFGIRTLEFERNPGLEPTSNGAGDQNVAALKSKPGAGFEPTANDRFMCRINGKLISMRGAGGFGAHDQLYRFHTRKDAWLIKAAQAMNFNFLRLHGSGIIATDEFYDLCDRMGMMVWQEFMVSNMALSGVHHEVWRAQTVQSIRRLRNHPSLVYWCGGNEFNPDSPEGDTRKIVDMFADCVRENDGTRPFSRAAQYVNDPHYNDQSGFYGGQKIAACSEYSGGFAGTIIGERSLRKFLPQKDVKLWPPATQDKLEQFLPPDVLAGWDNTRRGPFVFHTALTGRLSYWIGDLAVILPQCVFFGIPRTMDQAFEVSQVCGGYTTAYTAETFRSRWPLPSLYASWDYAPIWPMSLIWGPVDYYGAVLPCAYYYKRALEPLHILMQLDPREHAKVAVLPIDAFPKVFEPGEPFRGRVYVVCDLDHPVGQHRAEVRILNAKFEPLHQENLSMSRLERGPSSLLVRTIAWPILPSTPNQTALVCVSLKDAAGKLVSRSVYPIWISSERGKLVNDVATRRDHGPWLTELKQSPTKLRIRPISKKASFSGNDYLPAGTQHCAQVVVEVANIGDKPAFHTGIEITNADCRYLCDDNYFMLMPGETKRVKIEIDRSLQPFYDFVRPELVEPVGGELKLAASAWNAPAAVCTVAVVGPQPR